MKPETMSSTPTAEEPTRYTPVHEDAMVCESDGTYVRYDDYVKLRALVQTLVDAADKVKHWHDSHDGGMIVSGDSVFGLWRAQTAAASQGFTPTNMTKG
jgi:hypothetical protein